MTKTLLAAIESGELSHDQLRELIADQANELGLTFDEAVASGRSGKLPRNLLGSDLALLVRLWDCEEQREAV
jgi:hypothetical protein